MDTTGHVHLTGGLPCQNIPLGNGTQLGRIEIPLQVLPAPQQYKLVVGLAETEFENDWEVWVYPAQIKARACEDVLIIHEWSELLEKASSGRKILFVPPVDRIAGDIGFGFSTIFWNTTLTGHKPPHTMGILCDPQHPLFREFPTDFHTNWQWWELIHHSAVMPLDCLPVGLQPLVQVIDDWFKNRRLGLIFEAKLQSASIIVCSIDLFLADAGRLALRQFKQSLLSYMTSPAFSPKVQISQEHLQMLFRQDSGASASC